MDSSVKEAWELRLGETAAGFVYPPTPDIVAQVEQPLAAAQQTISQPAGIRPVKLVAGALAVILLLLALTLAIPPVRAAVFEFLQIGAVGIFVSEEPPATELAPGPTLLDLAGATTLAKASDRIDFAIRLPTYPADLGPPDQVYLQELAKQTDDGQVVILVWQDPSHPEEALLSLYQIDLPFYGIKQASIDILRQTTVAGLPAFWVQGPHQIQLTGDDYQDWVFVAGNVLIWTDDEMTYRLESGLSLDEAVRIAESLE